MEREGESLAVTRSQLRPAAPPSSSSSSLFSPSAPPHAAAKAKRPRIEDAPPLGTLSLEEKLEGWGLPSDLGPRLRARLGVQALFPFQTQALDRLLSQPRRDACVSAPTGSGKTLVYGLCVLRALLGRLVRRCRCVVVVPSRDLAVQVGELLKLLAEGEADLSFVVLGRGKTFEEEARALVSRTRDELGTDKFESKVDGVVTTPGRLIDHLDRTAGFTLEHVELLVVDEVDKLLSQSYQDWLERVYVRMHSVPAPSRPGDSLVVTTQRMRKFGNDALSVAEFVCMETEHPPLRRILCSATLTQDPQKLNSLALIHPLLLVHTEKLPALLSEESYLVKKEKDKLPFLRYLLEVRFPQDRVMVFASTVERATRLHEHLEKALAPTGRSVQLLSGEIRVQRRSRILAGISREPGAVLVCSDVAARGLDVENLPLVVSYDVPNNTVSYVHRAGRTARAGNAGLFVVLLGADQAFHFKQLRQELGLEDDVDKALVRCGRVEGFRAFKASLEGAAEVDVLPPVGV